MSDSGWGVVGCLDGVFAAIYYNAVFNDFIVFGKIDQILNALIFVYCMVLRETYLMGCSVSVWTIRMGWFLRVVLEL